MGEVKHKVRFFDKVNALDCSSGTNYIKNKESNSKLEHAIKSANEVAELSIWQDKKLEEWLKTHSLKSRHLTLKYLLSKSRITKPDLKDSEIKLHPCISIDLKILDEFHINLQKMANILLEKMTELTKGPTKFFGTIKGEKIGLLIDSSLKLLESNSTREAVEDLIEGQLSGKGKLFLASYGCCTRTLWDHPVHPSQSKIDESVEWLKTLEFDGGNSDLLEGLKTMFAVQDIDTICSLVHAKPNASLDVIHEFVEQWTAWRDTKLHFVSFECSDWATNESLKSMAQVSGGCYHCFNSQNKSFVYESSELQSLLTEMRRCESLMKVLKGIRLGWMGSIRVKVIQCEQRKRACLIADGPSQSLKVFPLNLEMSSFKQSTSEDWLKRNGLKAKHLDLYQVLAGNAHPYREQYIPIIRKTVQSQVYEQAMTQFTWKDGSLRNIHIDVLELLQYQELLGESVGIFQKRLEWLSSGSRKLFGTVTEDRCSNGIHFWKPSMVKPSGEHLQEAWRWIMAQECLGGRDFMHGIRKALENDEEKGNNDVMGLYLFSTGMSDHAMDVLISYTQEKCCHGNIKIHVVYLSLNSEVPNKNERTIEWFKELCLSSGGRMHWIKESGIIESDDIKLIEEEIEKAIDYSQKCSILIESVKKKLPQNPPCMATAQTKSNPNIIIPRKPTVLTLARSDRIRSESLKQDNSKRVKTDTSHIHLRSKSTEIGQVQGKGPLKKGKRKCSFSIPSIDIESQVSSVEWLRNLQSQMCSAQEYSLNENVTKRSIVNIDQRGLVRRCLKRMKWLLSGSRRYFGTILDKNVIILIDTSGSMVDMMMILKKHLHFFAVEQIEKHCKMFNFISFSNTVYAWKRSLVEVGPRNCKLIHDWIDSLEARGGTCTLEALQVAMETDGVDGIYLVTDGKPDTSTHLVLERVSQLNSQGRIRIHTISFDCSDGLANQFLRELAHNNHGRFLKVDPKHDMESSINKIDEMSFSDLKGFLSILDGDDFEILADEILKLDEI